eukprot:7379458-Prymnesium_polylepis.1
MARRRASTSTAANGAPICLCSVAAVCCRALESVLCFSSAAASFGGGTAAAAASMAALRASRPSV